MSIVLNKSAFLSGLREEPERLRALVERKVALICLTLHHEITSLTPVWTGHTLANYQWSTNTPAAGEIAEIDNGPTGPTNTMPLGSEPRRAPNQEIADRSFSALAFENPYQRFILVNNTETVGGLEVGEYPLPPLQQRSPNGMFAISVEYVTTLLEQGRI